MQGACERETFAQTHDFAPGADVTARGAGRAAMRALLEAAIQAAIDFLDMLDGDADLEDGGDAEPSLGAVEMINLAVVDLGAATAGGPIRLADLGGLDQSRWGEGDRMDREAGDDNGIADHCGLAEQAGRLRAAAPADAPVRRPAALAVADLDVRLSRERIPPWRAELEARGLVPVCLGSVEMGHG